MEDRERLNYYFQGLIPLLIFVMILGAMDVKLENLFLFITSFIWLFALDTPGLRKVTEDRKYKMSFINMVTKVNDVICSSLANAPRILSRSSKWILPIIFLGVVVLSSGVGNLFFLFLGLFYVEIINFAKKEIPKNLF